MAVKPQGAVDKFLEMFKTQAPSLAGMTDEAATEAIELMAPDELRAATETDEVKALVAQIQSWQRQCKTARAKDERQWLKNFDMYQGRQFTVYSKAQNKMVDVPAPDYNPQICVNVIEPVIRTDLAKTGANKPSAFIRPASNDLSDIYAAQAAEAIWEWFYDESRFQTDVFNTANLYRAVTGQGFVKVFFDPSVEDASATEAARVAAQKQADDMARQMQELALAGGGFGQAPTPQTMLTRVAVEVPPVMGKIRAEAVTPFHLFVPDLTKLTLEEQPYLIHAYPMTIETARMVYADYLDPDWNPVKVDSNTEVLNYSHLGVGAASTSAPDSVMIMEAYIKPNVSRNLPKGGFVVLVGSTVVSMSRDGWPYKHKQYPFHMITGIDTGVFYRKSIVQSITPIQNEINRTYGQVIKAKNIAVNPQMFYDEGSTDPRKILTKPGQYIPIRLGMTRPTAVPVSELPSYVLNLIETLRSHMDDISGQHQVSRATSPGADTAASAIGLLQEADNDFQFTTFNSIERLTATVAAQVLSLVTQFWDVPRMVKVAGEDKSFDVQMFSGSDIIGATDVQAESGSALPQSKAAKIQLVTEWMEKGFIPTEAGLEAIEMGQLGRVWNRLRADRSQAQRENQQMRSFTVEQIAQYDQQVASQMPLDPMTGQPTPQIDPMTGAPIPAPPMFPVNWYDNDEVHWDEHSLYAKSQEFQQLSPEQQGVLQAHAEAHLARIQVKVQQQAALGTGAGAAPGDNQAQGAPDDYAGAADTMQPV